MNRSVADIQNDIMRVCADIEHQAKKFQWKDIASLKPADGMIVIGWGEYRERDGFSPAFMRWYDSIGGWAVSSLPFYPTHWMPLLDGPETPSGKSGDVSPIRAPYELRLQIGKALDRLVCEDSTPEQVDKFIAVFAEFGLSITSPSTPS